MYYLINCQPIVLSSAVGRLTAVVILMQIVSKVVVPVRSVSPSLKNLLSPHANTRIATTARHMGLIADAQREDASGIQWLRKILQQRRIEICNLKARLLKIMV